MRGGVVLICSVNKQKIAQNSPFILKTVSQFLKNNTCFCNNTKSSADPAPGGYSVKKLVSYSSQARVVCAHLCPDLAAYGGF